MIPNMNNSIRWESVRTIIDDWEEMKIIIAGKWPLMENVLVWKRKFSAIMFYLFRSCLPYIQICTHRRTSFQWIHLSTFHCSCRVYQSNSSTVSINNEVSSRENGVYKIKVREGRVIYDYCRKRFVSEKHGQVKIEVATTHQLTGPKRKTPSNFLQLGKIGCFISPYEWEIGLIILQHLIT